MSPNEIEIACLCAGCGSPNTFRAATDSKCEKCQAVLLAHPTDAFLEKGTLNQCPLCGATHLYKQKDFNRALGVGLLVIGVVLAFFTYGISLLLVTIVDWFLYRYVGEVGICYQCQSTFRDSAKVNELPGFDLELYDYYRNLKKRPLSDG